MKNRFKGFNLIECLKNNWTEVCDTIQEAVIKTIPKKKKCNKAKMAELRKKEKLKAKKKNKIYPSECRVPKNSKER